MTRAAWIPAALTTLMLLAGCADDGAGPTTSSSVVMPASGGTSTPPQITTALPEDVEPPECPVPLPEAMNGPGLKLASFTVDNLGVYSSRDNGALACLLGGYDLVAVHDLAVPPYAGSYADGEAYRPDPASTGFFDAMRQQGFAYVIGPEDTGPMTQNHLTSGVTSWPVVFYKPQVLARDGSKPSGFIEPDWTANPSYDFVPFALPMKTVDGRFDFLLITAKLAEHKDDASNRRNELIALNTWIRDFRRGERDVLVMLAGATFVSCLERDQFLPSDATVIDPGCRLVSLGRKKPGDTAYLAVGRSATVEAFEGADIVTAMYPFWVYGRGGEYPGSPYNPALFDQYYAGTDPLAIRLLPGDSSDGD